MSEKKISFSEYAKRKSIEGLILIAFEAHVRLHSDFNHKPESEWVLQHKGFLAEDRSGRRR